MPGLLSRETGRSEPGEVELAATRSQGQPVRGDPADPKSAWPCKPGPNWSPQYEPRAKLTNPIVAPQPPRHTELLIRQPPLPLRSVSGPHSRRPAGTDGRSVSKVMVIERMSQDRLDSLRLPAQFDKQRRSGVSQRMKFVVQPAGLKQWLARRRRGNCCSEWHAHCCSGTPTRCSVFHCLSVLTTNGVSGMSRLPAALLGGPIAFQASARWDTWIVPALRSTSDQRKAAQLGHAHPGEDCSDNKRSPAFGRAVYQKP